MPVSFPFSAIVGQDEMKLAILLTTVDASLGGVLGPEAEAGFGWMAEDLNPDGTTGDARLASAALGARLVQHYGGKLARVIEDSFDFDLARFGPQG